MSEKVEQVAIALYASSIAPVDGTADEWPGETDEAKAHFRDHARVAIEAMREPTEAMIELAKGGVNCSDQDKAMQFYRDLIDEALK